MRDLIIKHRKMVFQEQRAALLAPPKHDLLLGSWGVMEVCFWRLLSFFAVLHNPHAPFTGDTPTPGPSFLRPPVPVASLLHLSCSFLIEPQGVLIVHRPKVLGCVYTQTTKPIQGESFDLTGTVSGFLPNFNPL